MPGIQFKNATFIRIRRGIFHMSRFSNVASFCVAATIWSSSAVRCCLSQEVLVQESGETTAPHSNESRASDEHSHLEVPYSILQRLIGADQEFMLTREQCDQHQVIVQQRWDADLRLTVIRHSAIHPQARILQAIEVVKHQLDHDAARRWLKTLTPEQRTAVAQKFHDEIAHVRQHNRPPQVLTHHAMEHPARAIVSNDLIWAMHYPSLLDRLELSTHQRSQIRQITTDADQELQEAVRQYAETGPLPKIDAVPFDLQPAEMVTKEMNQILTAEQQESYQRYCENRSKRLSEMIAANPNDAGMKILQMQPFGTLSSVSFDDTVTLHNDFLQEETQLATHVTPEQVKRLSECLAAAELSIARKLREHRESQTAQMRAAAAEIRPLIDEQIASKSRQIFALLTDDQQSILQDEKFRGLGLEALREPELQQLLELSEQQVSDLNVILSRQPEGLKSTAMRPVLFTANESLEEHRAKLEQSNRELQDNMSENVRIKQAFVTRQRADVNSVLTPEQRKKFESLTHLKPRI